MENKDALREVLDTFNDKYNDLEGLLNIVSDGVPSTSQSPIKSNIPQTPSFDSDYERMIRLASEEDDFKAVVTIFSSIVEKTNGIGIGKAKEVLREAYEIYIDNQKQLARLFGDQGQFDIAEEHLKNTHLGCQIGLGHFDKVVLKPKIEDYEVRQIFDNAMQNTLPQYFLQRVMTTSEEGNVEGIEKYISLSLKSLKERGVIEILDREKIRRGESSSNRKYESFFRLQMEFGKMYKKAYQIAVRKKVEEGVAYAVRDNKYQVSSDKTKIDQLREEAQDLMLDSVRKMVPDARMSDAFDATIGFFNEFLNPMYDELLVCREDGSHPLRNLYRPTTENGYVWGKIVGS